MTHASPPHPTSDPSPGPASEPAPAGVPRRMRQWTTDGNGVEGLEMSTVDVPTPGPGELVVRVGAWSLNYRDLLVIDGVDSWRPPAPVVPVSDAAGTVVAVGARVSRFALGDRVSAAFLPQWRTGALTPADYTRPTGGPVNRGMLAELVVVHQDEAVAVPRSLDDAHAATLPIAGVTAWHAVVRRARVTAGESVLIHGTGGVALFALQLCLALGARPIVTSGSPAKLARLAGLGDVRTVDRSRTDVVEAVLAMTGGAGVDHVVETVGGANLELSLQAVRLGGTIAFVGLLAGLAADISTYRFVTRNVTLHGIETGSQEMYAELADFVDAHAIIPVVDSTWALGDVTDALHHLAGGRHLGKVVVVPDGHVPTGSGADGGLT